MNVFPNKNACLEFCKEQAESFFTEEPWLRFPNSLINMREIDRARWIDTGRHALGSTGCESIGRRTPGTIGFARVAMEADGSDGLMPLI